MAEKKADVILHPIRMRIIQALVTGGRMTPYQLQEVLRDIPQATLYRHLRKLKDTGILVVADERQNRGTVESVYMLPEMSAELTQEEIQNATAEDHLTYFINFGAHLIGEFGRYLHQPSMDIFKDGVTYRQHYLYLTAEENIELIHGFRNLMMKYVDNKPDDERRKRIYSIIAHPEAEQQ